MNEDIVFQSMVVEATNSKRGVLHDIRGESKIERKGSEALSSLQLAGSYFRLSNTDQCNIIIVPSQTLQESSLIECNRRLSRARECVTQRATDVWNLKVRFRTLLIFFRVNAI